jgi:hypothetical protein
LPGGLDGAGDNRCRDEAEGDEDQESPGKDGLDDPPVPSGLEKDGRDPPTKDECSQRAEDERPESLVERPLGLLVLRDPDLVAQLLVHALLLARRLHYQHALLKLGYIR